MKKGYAGSVKNTGNQVVKAPFGETPKKSKGTVKVGNDLRVKGGK